MSAKTFKLGECFDSFADWEKILYDTSEKIRSIFR